MALPTLLPSTSCFDADVGVFPPTSLYQSDFAYLLFGDYTKQGSKFSVIEITQDHSKNVSQNVSRMYRVIVRTKRAGTKMINLPFMSNYHDTSSEQYQVGTQLMQQLADNYYYWLGVRLVFNSTTCVAQTFSANTARQSSGYIAAYNTLFNDAAASCGNGTYGYPRVTIQDDL